MKKNKRKIHDSIKRMIEQSDASPKRKEVATKVLESSYIDKLHLAAKTLAKPELVNKSFKKIGWDSEGRAAMLPTAMSAIKDGILKASIVGAQSIQRNEGADSETGKKAGEFLGYFQKNFPNYYAKALAIAPAPDQAMKQQVQNATGMSENKIREQIRARIKKILKGNK